MIYIVKTGDTLLSIARAYNINYEELAYDNQIVYPYRLAVGQSLFVDIADEKAQAPIVDINGYAYTFISEWVLEMTLPYLTRISVFSYGFSTGGYLINPILDDVWIVEKAIEYGVLPILTLTPLDMYGRFNNMLISELINNEEAINTLIEQLLQVMTSKGYRGLDIDFEYILATDRDTFTEFVDTVTTRMNENGYTVNVDLAPKTSDNQRGLLYEGKDYGALGAVANTVLLMTYEWGYTYGPPMAVAPINNVRAVVDYALTRIESNKISIGIANYGYDWPLPYIRDTSRAQTIGNVEAIQIAINNGAQIQFDEVAMSPFFNYNRDNIEHEVWFEDIRSLNEKFNLVREYGLNGLGYWQLMRYFRANWLQLEQVLKKR